jgi:hypothetical protein
LSWEVKMCHFITKGFSPMEYEGNDPDAVFFWEKIRCIYLGIVYNLYMLCVYLYIYIYIWSPPCKSLHAIESKNLSMLPRVLSPWEREGSDAAAVFFLIWT